MLKHGGWGEVVVKVEAIKLDHDVGTSCKA
jgi:hypothetical protein